MAPAARHFWFVLLLLVGDWYFDTSHGLLPFERPMCSTAVACRSLACKQQLCERFEATDLAQPTLLHAPFHLHNEPTGVAVPATSPRTPSGPARICLHMSFQC
jgi:hypothetical protein